MSLQERLDQLKAQAKTRIPPDAQAIMARAIEEARGSGMLARVLKVGDRAPDFTLTDSGAQSVSLASLRARGPVVLSFYRGRW